MESLKDDFVIYARCARGINLDGAAPKVREIVNIVFDEGPTNCGDSPHHASLADGRLDRQKALDYQEDTRGFISCFDDREKVKRVVQRIRDKELGISIVVSGVIDEVMQIARELDLTPHTINLSLGIRGKKELLPGPEVLELTTMCGHSLVATNLAKQALADVVSGRLTPAQAARMMGRPCICGIVNLTRAARLLEATSDQEWGTGPQIGRMEPDRASTTHDC